MNDSNANAIRTFHDLRKISPDDADTDEWISWMVTGAYHLLKQGKINESELAVIIGETLAF